MAVIAAGGLSGQTISHQISLPSGMTWCDDGMINGLFTQINTLRKQRGLSALSTSATGSKDAELRAVQFANYMATHYQGIAGFNPHEGYDTTAASLGYDLIAENLAYLTWDPWYIANYVWQDSLHLAAMLAADATVAGVSCVYSGGIPYWTYEPGRGVSAPVSAPPPSSPGAPSSASLDSEESSFVTLVNNYRVQNGLSALKISSTLQAAARWMSNDMAAKNYISHTDSLGRSSGARLAAFGYTYFPWGENIAAGYSDAQNTLTQWINACDPGPTGACTYAHRQNLLNPSFVAMGIARASGPGSIYGWYWTNDFGGVLDQPVSGTGPAPTPAASPVVVSFTAAPASITSGQSSVLTWNVTGASSVTIDNGPGDVSGRTSITVSPGATTTYHLTASNSSGATTASVTVTVNVPAGDTQPPSTPLLTSAVAIGAAQVNLTWAASTDNVAVTGYQIIRDGAAIGTATTQSWTDSTVTGATSYGYSVRAFDKAGNYSSPSNVLRATTPAAATPTGCPAPATGAFTGCYYANTMLIGLPSLVRNDPQINFVWGAGSPDPSLSSWGFSARWQGYFNFSPATYVFTATMSDGMRISVDGVLIIDKWRDQPGYTYTARMPLTGGTHLVTVEFYTRTGLPTAQVSWQAMP